MKVTSLEDVSSQELAEAWNRCWHGYPYAIQLGEGQMEAWIEKFNIDLAHSVSLRDEEKIIGLSLLSVEGQEGWIPGACIDPLYRGKNLFIALMRKEMEKARELNILKLTLEVLKGNHGIKTYRKLGFKIQRELLLFRCEAEQLPNIPGKNGVILRKVSLEDYFLARNDVVYNPPWQRRESFLRRFSPLEAWLNSDGSSGALILDSSEMLFDAWVKNWRESEILFSSILSLTNGEVSLINQPRDYLSAYLNQQGIAPVEIQYEMISLLPSM